MSDMIRLVLTIMVAIPVIVTCLSVAGKNMEGSKRRILRAIKSRLKNENKLLTLQLTLPVTDQFYANLEECLNAKELIQIKINVNKKAEAKLIGIDIAQRTNTELVQTLGHSILLYRDISNGYIASLLAKECASPSE